MASSELSQPPSDSSPLDALMRRVIGDIDEKQIAAARDKVAGLRARHPQATPDEIAEILIRKRCIDTGTVGLLASAPALIPGIGSTVALTAGLVADIGKTMEMQKQLILELAAAYDRELVPADRRNLLVLATGVDSGNKVAAKAAGDLVAKAGAKLAFRGGSRLIVKAIPLVGLVTSAAINVVSTYLIGRRAQAYMKLGPDAAADWRDSARVLSGVDERKLASFLDEVMAQLADFGVFAQRAGSAAADAGRAVGGFLQAQGSRLARRGRTSGAADQ